MNNDPRAGMSEAQTWSITSSLDNQEAQIEALAKAVHQLEDLLTPVSLKRPPNSDIPPLSPPLTQVDSSPFTERIRNHTARIRDIELHIGHIIGRLNI